MSSRQVTALKSQRVSSDPKDQLAREWRPRREVAASLALPVVFVLIVIVFSVLEPDTFATWNNARTLMFTQSVPAIFAIGLLMPLIVGQFDLSLGANLSVGLILVTGLPHYFGTPLVPSILVALAATTMVGFVNGFLVAHVGLNALVATLAVGSVLSGSVLWVTRGAVFYTGIPKSLTWLSTAPYGVPIPIVVLTIVGLGAWYFLVYTPTGRYFYAIGGSKNAALLAGVPVRRLTVLAFASAGLLAGVAGVMQASILRAGNPTVGPAFLLPGFTAAFLGATALKPGVFNVPGTILAVFTVSTGIIGLNLLGVPFFVEPIFAGSALLLAIIASRLFNRDVSG